jgi:O-antigen/teichoic acid export membrane protein
MDDLKTRAVSGVFWSVADRLGLQAVQFGVSVVLARLLLPSEFGIIGMLALFMAVAQSLMDSGFGSALIQKQDTDRVDESSIFFFNIIVGIALACALCLVAPWIAKFYSQPLLVGLTRFMSLSLVFNAFGLVQLAVLTKRLDFKTQMKVGIAASVASGMIGVYLALKGCGVWSLAVQSVSNALFRSAILWVANSWRPALAFSPRSLRQMVGFGSRLAAAGMLNTFFDNFYYAFIGKMFSATDLGYYTRANSMERVVTSATTQTVSRVMFPALATIQNDTERLKRYYQESIKLVVFVSFPIMLGLASVSDNLIPFLFGLRWQSSAYYFSLLCIAGILYPLHALNLNTLQVKGRSDVFLRLEIVKKILILVSVATSYRWGIAALLYAQIIVSVLAYLLNSHYSGKLIGYGRREQLRDIFPALLISLLVAIPVHLTGKINVAPNIGRLAIQGVIGVSLYVGLSRALRISALSQLADMARMSLRPTLTQWS